MNNIIDSTVDKYINEVGTRNVKGLKEIDDYFANLRKTNSQRQAVIFKEKLEKHLEKTFGPEFFIDLQYVGPHSVNCGIIPVLTSRKDAKKDIFENNKIKIFSVKKVHIILGMILLKNVIETPEQMTAIILHEIGHLTQCFKKEYDALIKKNMLLQFFETLNLFPIINTLIVIPYILTSRSLFFTQHVREYDADKFATRYGYGDELAEMLKNVELRNKEYYRRRRFTLPQILNTIKEMIMSKSHPSFEDRIKKISNDIKNEYADNYKDSDKIKKILDQSG